MEKLFANNSELKVSISPALFTLFSPIEEVETQATELKIIIYMEKLIKLNRIRMRNAREIKTEIFTFR